MAARRTRAKRVTRRLSVPVCRGGIPDLPERVAQPSAVRGVAVAHDHNDRLAITRDGEFGDVAPDPTAVVEAAVATAKSAGMTSPARYWSPHLASSDGVVMTPVYPHAVHPDC